MRIENDFSKTRRWVTVQAYKHDGVLHRQWSPAFLVEETEDYWALASQMSLVTESDGRRWMTKEQAIFILFKHSWMNVICMMKETGGICYYANIASPTLLDNGILKYVDYDLDAKLYPDGGIKELDDLCIPAGTQNAEDHEVVQSHGCFDRKYPDDHDCQLFDRRILQCKQTHHRLCKYDQE